MYVLGRFLIIIVIILDVYFGIIGNKLCMYFRFKRL